MKALTLKPRFALAVMRGDKTVEFRSWKTNHRGPLVIHAGMPIGRILCVVDLLDVKPDSQGGYRWILGNLRQIRHSAMRGQVGLWNVPPGKVRFVKPERRKRA